MRCAELSTLRPGLTFLLSLYKLFRSRSRRGFSPRSLDLVSRRHRSRRRSLSYPHPPAPLSRSLTHAHTHRRDTRTLTHIRAPGAVTSLIRHGGSGAKSQSAGSLLRGTSQAMCSVMVSPTKATFDSNASHCFYFS